MPPGEYKNQMRIFRDKSIHEIKQFCEELLEKISCFDTAYKRNYKYKGSKIREAVYDVNNHAFSAYRADDEGFTSSDFEKSAKDLAKYFIVCTNDATEGNHFADANPDMLYWNDELKDPLDAYDISYHAGEYDIRNFLEDETYTKFLDKIASENPYGSILNKILSATHKTDAYSLPIILNLDGWTTQKIPCTDKLRATLVEILTCINETIELDIAGKELDLDEKTETLTGAEALQGFDIEQIFSDAILLFKKTVRDINSLIDLERRVTPFISELEENLKIYGKLPMLEFPDKTNLRHERAMLLPEKISFLINECKNCESNVGREELKLMLNEITRFIKPFISQHKNTDNTLKRRLGHMEKSFELISKVITSDTYLLDEANVEEIECVIENGLSELLKTIDSRGLSTKLGKLSNNLKNTEQSVIKLTHQIKANECLRFLEQGGNTKIPQNEFSIVHGQRCNFGKWWHNMRQIRVEDRRSDVQHLLVQIAKLIPSEEDKSFVLESKND